MKGQENTVGIIGHISVEDNSGSKWDTSYVGSPKVGVPQEAVLSPLLYTIYMADIPKSEHTTMYLYADDISR